MARQLALPTIPTEEQQVNKKQLAEAAKVRYEQCTKMLKAHEILWKDIWDAQPNPFLRIKEHTSEHQKNMRALIINPWIAAKKEYEEARKTVRSKE
jgi:hypothetical protein